MYSLGLFENPPSRGFILNLTVRLRMNPRDDGFSNSPKLYISSLKLAFSAGFVVKISLVYVVVFQHKGPKSSFLVVLFYSIILDLE